MIDQLGLELLPDLAPRLDRGAQLVTFDHRAEV
jgi:hypothetical protein